MNVTKAKSDVLSLKGMESLIKNKYRGSLIKALVAIYPEYSWKIYKFEKVPNNFWEDKENVMEAIDCIKKELGIKTKEDWQRVSPGF